MNKSRRISVYCDESCHIENDHIPIMAWGAVSCETGMVRDISEAIRAIKTRHGLAPTFEAKWTKISPAKVNLYLELINFFLGDDRLRFRGLLVPDKEQLDHGQFNQSHDEWYYKMYYTMLRMIFCPPHRYHIYIDIKDTRGGSKTRKLHDVLANSLNDFDRKCIERVQQVRSHEVEILQLTDLLIGALGYANREMEGSTAKTAVVTRLREALGQNVLTQTSAFSATKFNILRWQPQGGA